MLFFPPRGQLAPLAMSLRRPLEDESLVDESLVKKRKALSTVVVIPDDSQSLVALESHVEAQAPAAQAEEISKEEYQRVENTIVRIDLVNTKQINSLYRPPNFEND